MITFVNKIPKAAAGAGAGAEAAKVEAGETPMTYNGLIILESILWYAMV